jgi:glycosyl transferase family 87
VIAETVAEPNDPLKKAFTHALAFWAVVAPSWILVNSALGGRFALDFHYAFLPAARAVLHGNSPYSALGSRALSEGTAFLYPPLGAYLLAPFTVLPTPVAETLAIVLVAAAVPATLLLLGVRDWRCYAIGLLWWPTIIGIQTGNLTLPMLLGLALIWHYRDRPVVAGLAAGLVIALKLFFWPLLVWFVATRRYRTAAIAALATVILVVAPWAGIGFAGLRSYPHLLSTISGSEGPRSYSVAALFHAVVPNWMAASMLESLLGAVVLLLAFRAGRRGRERDAFALAIVATLVLTPLLELHYLAALLVVVALARPQLGVAWVAPLLIWGAPATVAGSTIQVVHVLVVAAAVVALALSDGPLRFARSARRPAERLGLPMRRGAGPSLSPP